MGEILDSTEVTEIARRHCASTMLVRNIESHVLSRLRGPLRKAIHHLERPNENADAAETTALALRILLRDYS